jgi:hypothetical protein
MTDSSLRTPNSTSEPQTDNPSLYTHVYRFTVPAISTGSGNQDKAQKGTIETSEKRSLVEPALFTAPSYAPSGSRLKRALTLVEPPFKQALGYGPWPPPKAQHGERKSVAFPMWNCRQNLFHFAGTAIAISLSSRQSKRTQRNAADENQKRYKAKC